MQTEKPPGNNKVKLHQVQNPAPPEVPGADLHMHSTASDGSLSPAALVKEGAGLGLRAMALTDHDTVGGIDEFLAAAESAGIAGIPGVEIGVTGVGTHHILGYYIDHKSKPLVATLKKIAAGRKDRTPRIISNLAKCGIDITAEMVLARAEAPDSVGRLHFAETIVEAGYVGSVGEAFEKYLNHGMPGYASRPKITAARAIRLIRDAGGIAVLAHPRFIEIYMDGEKEFESLIVELIDSGIEGMEVLYTNHSSEEVSRYLSLADRLGLVVTGGSDYHGPDKPDYKLGMGSGFKPLPISIYRNIEAWRINRPGVSSAAAARRL